MSVWKFTSLSFCFWIMSSVISYYNNNFICCLRFLIVIIWLFVFAFFVSMFCDRNSARYPTLLHFIHFQYWLFFTTLVFHFWTKALRSVETGTALDYNIKNWIAVYEWYKLYSKWSYSFVSNFKQFQQSSAANGAKLLSILPTTWRFKT